ncbi:MAG TPA: hypothetical protein VFG68_15330 [Fimbriiglobus sp.]|nr:hypothetical protein [Fimbriiglobus sp.]
MTILGKLLVFVVLVLSIVWNALVVNAYVARTNWHKRAAEYQQKATDAAASATGMKDLLGEERAAAAEKDRAQRAELERLYAQNRQLLADRQKLVVQVNDAFNQLKAQGAQANIHQTNIEKLQQQVNALDQQTKDVQKRITDTTLSAQQDRVKAERAGIEAASQQQRAERLAVQVQQLSEIVAEYERKYGSLQTLSPGVQRSPVLPEGWKGTISRTDGTVSDLHAGREVWVELTPGLDSGLKPGAILSVHRLNGVKGTYLGTITVARVNAKDAVGRFTPANPRAVTADGLPKPGDQLVASTSNR